MFKFELKVVRYWERYVLNLNCFFICKVNNELFFSCKLIEGEKKEMLVFFLYVFYVVFLVVFLIFKMCCLVKV